MDFNISDLLFIIPLIIMVIIVIKLLVSMHENKKYWDDVKNDRDDMDLMSNPEDTNEDVYDERVMEIMRKSQEDPNFDFEKAVLEDLEKMEQNK